jgi:hypothetical protein
MADAGEDTVGNGVPKDVADEAPAAAAGADEAAAPAAAAPAAAAAPGPDGGAGSPQAAAAGGDGHEGAAAAGAGADPQPEAAAGAAAAAAPGGAGAKRTADDAGLDEAGDADGAQQRPTKTLRLEGAPRPARALARARGFGAAGGAPRACARAAALARR